MSTWDDGTPKSQGNAFSVPVHRTSILAPENQRGQNMVGRTKALSPDRLRAQGANKSINTERTRIVRTKGAAI